mgnify:CR=1 FL=1
MKKSAGISLPACICGFIAGGSRPVKCGSSIFARYIHILPIDFCSNDRISNTIRQQITIAEFELQRRFTAFVKSILNAIRRITFHNQLLQPASGFPFVLAFTVIQRIADCIISNGSNIICRAFFKCRLCTFTFITGAPYSYMSICHSSLPRSFFCSSYSSSNLP